MTAMKRSERRSHGRRRRRRGQALAEFALVAPVFFLVLFGIIEAGRFIFYYETLNNATREGARYAIVNGANSLVCPTGPAAPGSVACDTAGNDVVQRVRDTAFGVLGSGVTVDRLWHDGTGFETNNGRGSTVTVTASYTYSTLIPLLPLPQITVRAESSLVVNN
jgi:Flp pilus assembly protein TadG